jgi:hypothetical protein
MEHLKRRETIEQLNNKDAASLLRKGHLDGQSLDTAHQRPELHDLSLPCAEHVTSSEFRTNPEQCQLKLLH